MFTQGYSYRKCFDYLLVPVGGYYGDCGCQLVCPGQLATNAVGAIPQFPQHKTSANIRSLLHINRHIVL